MEKRAQVTIFVILGISIVAVLLLLLAIKTDLVDINSESQDLSPRAFIQNCVEDAVKNSEYEIIENGMVDEIKLTIMYNSSNITYHCYQADNYRNCYNLYPMLEEKLENKIYSDISGEINSCFEALIDNLESDNYDVSQDGPVYSVDILPERIEVSITNNMQLSKDEFGESFENFDTSITSPLFEFIQIERQIILSESATCNFEYNGYTLLYPDYRITLSTRDGSKIYKVKDTKTDKEFAMAVRGCIIPSGLF